MEDWELKNIIDRSLYESEQRTKANMISQKMDSRKTASDSIIPWWVWIVGLLVIGGIANILYIGYIVIVAIAHALGFI